MMDFKSTSIDEIEKKAWADFVMNHPKGNVFQIPEIFNVFSKTKNFKPLLTAACDKNDKVIAILVSVVQKELRGPLGNLTSRCVSWGGPLIENSLEQPQKKELLNFILQDQNKKAKKEAIYMECRNLWDTSDYKEVFFENGYEFEEELNIQIDLTQTEDELMADIKRDKKRGIKKAKASNLQFEVIDNESGIDTFYTMLKETYKDAKVPLSDITFFKSIYEELIRKGYANCFLAKFNEIDIGGRLVLNYKKTVYDWYAGDINEYIGYHPNEFLLWNILVHSKKNGYELFDFMGAGRPDEEYGVRDWKLRFGGKLLNNGRYKNVYKKTKMKIAKVGLEIMKKVK